MRQLVLVLCAAAMLAAAAAAKAPSFVVQGDTRIDSYRVRGDGTLAGAMRTFGKPTTRVRHPQHGICVARWSALGMRIEFYNLADRNPCLGANGFFSSAILTGRRWRTSAGLRMGATLSAVRSRHPAAEPAQDRGVGWWWLVERVTEIGSNGLEAKITNGRVTAFRVTYQAGGE